MRFSNNNVHRGLWTAPFRYTIMLIEKNDSPTTNKRNDHADLKVLVGHLVWSDYARELHESMAARARNLGWRVETFCLTINPPGPRLTFQDLDKKVRRKDREILRLRDRLKETLRDADVFWNFSGANVHPSWLRDFNTLNVYGCFDDPESSSDLSEPVARYFDAALVGNLACLPLYQSWGIRNLAWMPLGLMGIDTDPDLTPDIILEEERPIDAVFFGEKEAFWRRKRLDALEAAFPKAMFRGRGWPGGYLSNEERKNAYRQTKIGWNLHNSVGPVNLRVFALMAMGVMQICDNRCRAGQVFKLGEEIAGFDTIEECIELTNYYLAHDEERKRVAANGYKRYMADYTEEKIWKYLFDHFEQWTKIKRDGKISPPIWERTPRKGTGAGILANRILRPLGMKIDKIKPPDPEEKQDAEPQSPYLERPESGAENWSEKQNRLAEGGLLEWPNMIALNWACATLVGNAKRIVELGGGTGCFAYEASAEPSRRLLCADLDANAINWARNNRARDNVEYVSRFVTTEDGPFDLLVSCDVIEHLKNFPSFLRLCCDLAPRAIITTPNRRRSPEADNAGPPSYHQHVREWSAGEFYWVLRSFYRKVKIFGMPNPNVPIMIPLKITDRLTPLIAHCEGPLEIPSARKKEKQDA